MHTQTSNAPSQAQLLSCKFDIWNFSTISQLNLRFLLLSSRDVLIFKLISHCKLMGFNPIWRDSWHQRHGYSMLICGNRNPCIFPESSLQIRLPTRSCLLALFSQSHGRKLSKEAQIQKHQRIFFFQINLLTYNNYFVYFLPPWSWFSFSHCIPCSLQVEASRLCSQPAVCVRIQAIHGPLCWNPPYVHGGFVEKATGFLGTGQPGGRMCPFLVLDGVSLIPEQVKKFCQQQNVRLTDLSITGYYSWKGL